MSLTGTAGKGEGNADGYETRSSVTHGCKWSNYGSSLVLGVLNSERSISGSNTQGPPAAFE